MEVAHRRAHMAVTEQTLDGVDVDPGFEQMRGERMAQRVNATAAGNAGSLAGSVIHALGRLVVERTIAPAVGEQPEARAGDPPVLAQHLQQPCREQRIAILAALALAHLDTHPVGGRFDVRQLQRAHL